MSHLHLLTAILALSLAAVVQADPKPEGKSAPADKALVDCLQRAFEDGFVIGPKRLQEAQKHLNQARRLAPDDPRVDFAQGLVLMKQSQMKQAIVQFEAAIERDDSRFWPAWQAAIWAQLAEKRYEPGLKRLVEFAGIVRSAEPPGETSEAQREAARWIGQVIAAASSADDAKKLDELLAGTSNDVLKAIGDDLWDELEEGRDAIGAREFALGQAAGKARQTAEKSDRVRKDRKAAALDKTIEGAGKQKEDNEKTKEEWKTWIDDVLAKSDKELGRLEKDFNFLDQRAQSLTQSITLVGQELTAMELVLNTSNPRTTNPLAMQNAAQAYMQRQNQMLSYQLDYNATVGRMSDLAQAGAQAAQQRADAITQYEKATGDLTKKNAGLDKWAGRLKNEKQKLTINKPTAKGGKAAADKKPAAITFKSILPFDVVHEKERLLASFAPPGKAEDGKAAKADQ